MTPAAMLCPSLLKEKRDSSLKSLKVSIQMRFFREISTSAAVFRGMHRGAFFVMAPVDLSIMLISFVIVHSSAVLWIWNMVYYGEWVQKSLDAHKTYGHALNERDFHIKSNNLGHETIR